MCSSSTNGAEPATFARLPLGMRIISPTGIASDVPLIHAMHGPRWQDRYSSWYM